MLRKVSGVGVDKVLYPAGASAKGKTDYKKSTFGGLFYYNM
jgi:hypothetical protein